MQEQLDQVTKELHSTNSRFTNMESTKEGSASSAPSTSTLPAIQQPMQGYPPSSN